ncbi:DUF4097 family beta strand repeat-containing protein [Halothermothrix orenii]|uniref:Bacteriocin-type signal sequence n=1 Tax=Halothermothrix orenii (strain H 168 / OCM 544 / DSM 9562) TaxID=373903 RepID=B8CWA8_HALOH|nr:DUF4097 family beta strand repeat-containing protein [Halothermothrix orenii]ACL69577.1 bacteriocin-type signal sequence [Halothermothrix orenii H 168]
MSRKLILSSLIVVFIALMLTGCFYEYAGTVRHYTVDYVPGVTINLENKTGDIIINNWSQDYILVEAKIKAGAESESKAEMAVDATVVDIKKEFNNIYIKPVLPDFTYDNRVVVDFEINIPDNFNAELYTATGDITVEECKGDLILDTSTGDITVDEALDTLMVEVGTGDVNIGYASGETNVDVSTGDIDANLNLEAGTNNRVTTSTGDISLILRDPSTYLVASVGTGDLNFDLNGVEMQIKEISDNTLEAIIGGTDASNLYIHTSTGNVTLKCSQ